MPAKDQIFSKPLPRVEDFDFGEKTAVVFDDMLDRSVPYYAEIQRMVAELAADFAEPGGVVYDLGCSTGTTFLAIDRLLADRPDIGFVGLDSSPEMLSRARDKLRREGIGRSCDLRLADFNHGVDLPGASVVIMLLTLQFVRPLHRECLLGGVYRNLREKGCVILVEKVLGEFSTFNRLFIEHYYEMKRRSGYSGLEISQKREALENVLIPYRLEENRELLRRAGFREIDVFFKWYNFCGIIAAK